MIREAELNQMKLNKGSLEGNRFPIWDVVGPCTNDDCPLERSCPYSQRWEKCRVQVNYMRTVLKITIDNLPEKTHADVSEYKLLKIGLLLVPLFKQLVTMKMVEHALDTAVIGSGGQTKIHPVYKEIRVITSQIDSVLVQLGIIGSKQTGRNFIPYPKDVFDEDGTMEGNITDGDPSYYDNMQGKHAGMHDDAQHKVAEEQNIVKKKKKKKKTPKA